MQFILKTGNETHKHTIGNVEPGTLFVFKGDGRNTPYLFMKLCDGGVVSFEAYKGYFYKKGEYVTRYYDSKLDCSKECEVVPVQLCSNEIKEK